MYNDSSGEHIVLICKAEVHCFRNMLGCMSSFMKDGHKSQGEVANKWKWEQRGTLVYHQDGLWGREGKQALPRTECYFLEESRTV